MSVGSGNMLDFHLDPGEIERQRSKERGRNPGSDLRDIHVVRVLCLSYRLSHTHGASRCSTRSPYGPRDWAHQSGYAHPPRHTSELPLASLPMVKATSDSNNTKKSVRNRPCSIVCVSSVLARTSSGCLYVYGSTTETINSIYSYPVTGSHLESAQKHIAEKPLAKAVFGSG
jgi:hypothetical protein